MCIAQERKQDLPKKKVWVRPGRKSMWWDDFVDEVVIAEEVYENLAPITSAHTQTFFLVTPPFP